MRPGLIVAGYALILLIALSLSADGTEEKPPRALIKENLQKASAIVEGKIESTSVPRTGVTVAKFRIERSWRGTLKPGEIVEFASFREQDRYPDTLLRSRLIVFLRSREARYRPPAWETATDFSEFISTPALQKMLPRPAAAKTEKVKSK